MDALEMALLLDYYGGMLTDKQREVLTLHCEEDMSLAEIAQETGVSRQGVHDMLTRTANPIKSSSIPTVKLCCNLPNIRFS